MMRKTAGLFLALWALLMAGTSYAETGRILRNELPKNEREFLETGDPMTGPERGIPEEGEGVDVETLPKFRIDRIYLKTPEDKMIVKPLVGEKKLRKILSKYEGRELNILDIRTLVKELNDEYGKKGYITTRIYLEPDQNLQGGELRLTVLEGRIEDITLDNDTSKDRRKVFSAFTNEKGKIFNISHIDNGIDNLNRVESSSSKIDIIPGERQGYSRIAITSEKKKPIRLVLNYEDTAEEKQRYRAGIEYDNLLGMNDILSLSYRGDAGKLFKESDRRNDYTESYSLSYSFPVKTWTFGISHDSSDERSLIAGGSSGYSLRTRSRSTELSTTKVLYRNADMKINLLMNLAIKDERTYIDGTRLITQDRDITAATIGINGMFKAFGGVSSYGLTYTKGLRGFGSGRDNAYSAGTAASANVYPEDRRYQSGKWNLNLNYYKPFYFGKQGITVRTVFNGQYTDDPLFSSEKFSIGNYGDIKGFPDTVSGDMGYSTKVELGYILPADRETGWGEFIYRIRPYVEASLGKVRDSYDMYGNRKSGIRTMSSYALGVRYYGEILTLDFGLAKPDKGRDLMKTEDSRGYVSVTATF